MGILGKRGYCQLLFRKSFTLAMMLIIEGEQEKKGARMVSAPQ